MTDLINHQYVNRLLLGLSPYLVLCGVAYNSGYWSWFGINIFQYGGFIDLTVGALIPVGGVSIAVFIVSGSQQLLTKYISKYPDLNDRSVLENIKNPKSWPAILRITAAIGAMFLTIFIVFENAPGIADYFEFLVFQMAFWSIGGVLFDGVFEKYRFLIVPFVLANLVISCYLIGVTTAVRVAEGEGSLGVPIYYVAESEGNRYLGHINGYLFSLGENDSVSVQLVSDLGSFTLVHSED